ncbi:MAG: elongation factor P [Dehalococcoidia bacterium]
MISTADLRKGVTIELDNKLMTVLDYAHIKTGRGSAQVKIKFRDARSGAIFEQSFQSGTKWPRASVERRDMQYLYKDDQFFYFMNTETFEQLPVSGTKVEDADKYLKENDPCQLVLYGEEVIGIELPLTVTMTIVSTERGIKGDTAQGALKPATTETGLIVNVPLFVDEGTKIKISTESGNYIERVS